MNVGLAVGPVDGEPVGDSVVGFAVGVQVGERDGVALGDEVVGAALGPKLGALVGGVDGPVVGNIVGLCDGNPVGGSGVIVMVEVIVVVADVVHEVVAVDDTVVVTEIVVGCSQAEKGPDEYSEIALLSTLTASQVETVRYLPNRQLTSDDCVCESSPEYVLITVATDSASLEQPDAIPLNPSRFLTQVNSTSSSHVSSTFPSQFDSTSH